MLQRHCMSSTSAIADTPRWSSASVYVISVGGMLFLPSPGYAQWTKTIDCPEGTVYQECVEIPAERNIRGNICVKSPTRSAFERSIRWT